MPKFPARVNGAVNDVAVAEITVNTSSLINCSSAVLVSGGVRNEATNPVIGSIHVDPKGCGVMVCSVSPPAGPTYTLYAVAEPLLPGEFTVSTLFAATLRIESPLPTVSP